MKKLSRILYSTVLYQHSHTCSTAIPECTYIQGNTGLLQLFVFDCTLKLHFKHLSYEHIYSLTLEGPSLLGLSHISVNASMAINDTALTSGTISRLEAPDPIDTLDLTVCPADDILDGCKVS